MEHHKALRLKNRCCVLCILVRVHGNLGASRVPQRKWGRFKPEGWPLPFLLLCVISTTTVFQFTSIGDSDHSHTPLESCIRIGIEEVGKAALNGRRDRDSLFHEALVHVCKRLALYIGLPWVTCGLLHCLDKLYFSLKSKSATAPLNSLQENIQDGEQVPALE